MIIYVFIGEVSPEEERPAKRAKMGSTSTTTSSTAGKFFYVLHLQSVNQSVSCV